MTFRQTCTLALVAATLSGVPSAAEWPSTERVDLDAVYRIKDEAFERSQVMEIESYLTDVYGPRLTGSPNIKEAADWAQTRLRQWGLANVHLERFPFGRGWQNERFIAHAVAPRAYPLVGFPKAWSAGTNGPVTADAVLVSITTEKDFDAWRGKLRGKIALAARPIAVPAHFEPLASRLSDAELSDLFRQPAAGRGSGRGGTPPVDAGFVRERL
jgi:carboxypeptidase Q